MDLLDLAILALRLALVGVLYAFLVVVLRAAGRGCGRRGQGLRRPCRVVAIALRCD